MSKPVLRINFWSSPRNISTALMYSFAQRPDFSVVDEPLYAAYLNRFPDLNHPGQEAILGSQYQEAEEVIQNVLLHGHFPTPYVFFKQMTHHLAGIDFSFTAHMANVLLIRDPRAIVASYARVIPRPTLQDVGLELQLQLWRYLKKRKALQAVIDTEELLKNPREGLKNLCKKLSIAFNPGMLRWEPGPRQEDGVWAPHWYGRVHRSTGFLPPRTREYDLSPYQEELAASCMPLYEQLKEEALKAKA
jgi:hypothetical protein